MSIFKRKEEEISPCELWLLIHVRYTPADIFEIGEKVEPCRQCLR